jgi:thiamine phosphate synthase YjbQ (UPF0047 family)
MFKKFSLETKFNEVISLTDRIKEIVAESGIKSDLCGNGRYM